MPSTECRQLPVPGSATVQVRKLPVVCPKCRKPVIGDFVPGQREPTNVRCSMCNWRFPTLEADTVEINLLCPKCRVRLIAHRRAVTHDIDKVMCPSCLETTYL
jgi:ssDNA-binding Zn-finger/Zn-ribbon topoisomerase 1